MMRNTFNLPIYHTPVVAHRESKKSILLEILKLTKDPRSYNPSGNERVYSDYTFGDEPKARKYKDEVIDAVKPNIDEFIGLVGAKQLNFGQIWFQRYETHSFHGPHNHWPSLFSVVYFLEFDPTVHRGTIFANPNKLQIDLISRAQHQL